MANDKNSFISGEGLGGEDKLLVSHVADMVSICERTCSSRFSAFLTEGEAALAERFLRYEGFSHFMMWGGFEGAQRVMLGVFGEYEEPMAEEFPLAAVKFRFRECDSLSHRDFLGSFMSLGITRNQIGDIICSEGRAYALLTRAAAEQAVFIEKIGRVGVKCAYADSDEKIVRNDKFSEISGTVASLRLDCVVGTATRLSREKSCALIRSGSVSVNHGVTESVSDTLKEGDVLSVRGFGRYILSSVGDRTKKDRIHIVIKKYI